MSFNRFTLAGLAIMGGSVLLVFVTLNPEPRDPSLPFQPAAVGAATVAAPTDRGPEEPTVLVLEDIRFDGERAALEIVVSESPTPDLRVALEGQLRRHPHTVPQLLQLMEREQDPHRFFSECRAVEPHLDRPAHLQRAIDMLRAVEPRKRAAGVLMLLGRREPSARSYLLELYELDQDAQVRARAGRVLARIVNELPESEAHRARETARGAFRGTGMSTDQVVAAAELLAGSSDRADYLLLRNAFDETNDKQARAAILFALALSARDEASRAEVVELVGGQSPP